MLFRKLKNRIYTFLKKRYLRFSYIEKEVIVGKKAYVGNSEICGNVTIGEFCRIHRCLIGKNVKIGRYTSIWGPNTYILSEENKIEIGNFCSIARDVSIQEYMHNHQKITTHFIGRNVFKKSLKDDIVSKGDIKIGHDVWIGTGVQIMSGVTIGNGVVIAANSTVTKNVPPYAVVAGTPAKIIKMRFSEELVNKIEKTQWWNWDIQKIKDNEILFKSEISLNTFDYES